MLHGLVVDAAADRELLRVAGQCDGVRCDMAMLVLPDVFERTWGRLAPPFWPEATHNGYSAGVHLRANSNFGEFASRKRPDLAEVCQERVYRIRSLFGLLAHPPMTRSFQHCDFCAGALGRTARERFSANKGIFRSDNR